MSIQVLAVTLVCASFLARKSHSLLSFLFSREKFGGQQNCFFFLLAAKDCLTPSSLYIFSFLLRHALVPILYIDERREHKCVKRMHTDCCQLLFDL